MAYRAKAVILAWVLTLAAGGFWATVRADEPAASPDAAADEPASPEDQAQAQNDAEYYELYKIFADTLDQVERNYVKDVSRRELMEAAIRGVLDRLDPYSNYIGPEELGRFKASVESQFGGIGIQVDMTATGQLLVVSPLVGSPAYRAGLQAGDVIVEIEGQSTAGIELDDCIRRLKGEAGTSVTITVVHRNSPRPHTVTIQREIIHLETVMGDRRDENDHWDFMLDDDQGIGYIRITAFSRDTARHVQAALEELENRRLRGLVIDLRFNPGGLLTSAIEIADLFVSEGKIVSTSGRNSPERSWVARQPGTFGGFPIAVIVNRYTASASEIVSACLQDHRRAVVIGERTWGKGSVQNVIELEDGKSALKLTTASYQRPNGHNIHRFPDSKETDEWGVVPDPGFEIQLDDRELEQLVRYRHQRDILLVNHSVPRDVPETPPEPDGDAQPEGAQPDDAQPDEAKPDQPQPDDAKPDEPQPDKVTPDEAKPDATEPTEGQELPPGPPTQQPPPGGNDAGAATQEETAGPQAFVDRQLQKAIDYLTDELAKVE